MYLPDQWDSGKRRSVVLQLGQDAERLADGLAIWRKSDPAHIAPLLALYKIHGTEDAKAEGAPPYLSAAIAQCRQLESRASAASPAVVRRSDGASTGISWTLVMMDIFGALERGQRPTLFRDEVVDFIGPVGPSLLDPRQFSDTKPPSAFDKPSSDVVLGAFGTLVLIGHDAATSVATSKCCRTTLESLWARLDDVYRWGRTATSLNGRIHWYGILVWATSITIDFALVNLIGMTLAQRARLSAGNDQAPCYRFDELVGLSAIAQRRVETQLCAYLPQTYQDVERDWLNVLAFLPGVTCSIARILDLAQTLARTSVPDPVLFPGGAPDRLRMLEHVLAQIRDFSQGYPSVKLDQTLEMLESEQRRMQEVLSGIPWLIPSASIEPLSNTEDDGASTRNGSSTNLHVPLIHHPATERQNPLEQPLSPLLQLFCLPR